MRRTPLPARPAASHHVLPRGFWSVLADSSRLRLYRPIRPIQAEIPKKTKKKGCETHRLSQILNPTFSSLHTDTSNKLSASLSLRHSSLTLFVLSANVSACYKTLSQCRVNHLTHFSSFLLQLSLSLSCILNSGSFQS